MYSLAFYATESDNSIRWLSAKLRVSFETITSSIGILGVYSCDCIFSGLGVATGLYDLLEIATDVVSSR